MKIFVVSVLLLAAAIANSSAKDPPRICKTSEDCRGPNFCKTYTGQCMGPYGYCTPTPIHCFSGNGVCGCDGKTYDSECEAAKYNVSIMYQGQCLKDNTCKYNTDCGNEDQFCFKTDTCNGVGNCNGIPDYCPLEISIVCGCNGKNYMNLCEALANSSSVIRIGPCKTSLYCTKSEDCEANETCIMPTGICNGDASQGVCVTKPSVCSHDDAPVCGCDDRTYPNTCIALQQGATLSKLLPCI